MTGIMEDTVLELQVVKRNGKKVDFDGTKIAIAIKKGFDSLIPSEENATLQDVGYSEKDVNKVYHAVMERIKKEYGKEEKIKIETIQDMIEEELKKKHYQDVYESFKAYREQRNQSRELFSDNKRLHKFLKTIEDLGLKSAHEENAKRENANVDGDTAMV